MDELTQLNIIEAIENIDLDAETEETGGLAVVNDDLEDDVDFTFVPIPEEVVADTAQSSSNDRSRKRTRLNYSREEQMLVCACGCMNHGPTSEMVKCKKCFVHRVLQPCYATFKCKCI